MTVGRIPSVEGGIQPTLLTAKGDLISATAASTVARLAVGSNDQILVADSSTSTGLKWAAPSSGAYVLVKARTQFTTVADTGTTFDSVFTSTYQNYKVIIDTVWNSANGTLTWKYRYGSTTQATNIYSAATQYVANNTNANLYVNLGSAAQLCSSTNNYGSLLDVTVTTPATSATNMPIAWTGYANAIEAAVMGAAKSQTTQNFDGFQISALSGTVSGYVTIYGMVKS
jgi:hypothetical protein